MNNLAHPTKNTINECYNSFTKSILVLAKKHIPRGFRKTYIPGWDEECHHLANSNEEITETAKRLIEHLDKTRSERWIEAVESIDFTHSSRKAWSTLHRLTGTKPKTKPPPVVKTSDIASAFINNGKFKNKNKTFTRKVNTELREQKTKPSATCVRNLQSMKCRQHLRR